MTSSGMGIELAGGGVVALRPVAPADDEFLLAVYASTRADELALVPWSAEQKQVFLRIQFDTQRREYDVRFPDAEYDVILFDGQPVGRLWIGRNKEEIRVLDIALLPAAQNKGIGGALIRRLIEEARQTGKKLRHMVFVLNTDAKRFYERLGFRVFEEVGAYIHMEWQAAAEAAGDDAT